MDKQAAMRKKGILAQREVGRLGRQTATSLKEDCKEQTQKVGEAAMMDLASGDIKETWRILKVRHMTAGGITAKPCYAERKDLYGFQVSSGEYIPASRDPILLPDVDVSSFTSGTIFLYHLYIVRRSSSRIRACTGIPSQMQ